MRLAPRLTLSFMAAIALASAVSIVLVRTAVEGLFKSYLHDADARRGNAYRSFFEDLWRERGSWEGAQAALMAEADADGRGHEAVGRNAANGRIAEEERVVLADAEGRIVADNGEDLLGSIHPRAHLAQGISLRAGEGLIGTLMVGTMADPALSGANSAFLSSVTSILLWAAAVSAIAASSLGLIVSAGIARPLARLDAAARLVASGDYSVRLPERGRDETARLSASFNSMASELARLDGARRRLIADAAHELRTPAALILGTVEAILDGVYAADRPTLESLHEETLRLGRLIDGLRELEALESGRLRLEKAAFDVVDELRNSAAVFANVALKGGIALQTEPAGGNPVILRADRLRVGQVIRNLVANALAHAPSGGSVRASAGRRPDGSVFILVEDSGPGIPPEERKFVFERFYRIDPEAPGAKPGSGLGLAIALEIMKAHGGTLSAGESPLGGAAFEALFPPST